MQAVQEGQTVSGAAKQFYAPRKLSMIGCAAWNESRNHGTNPGPCTALTVKEVRLLRICFTWLNMGFRSLIWLECLHGPFHFGQELRGI